MIGRQSVVSVFVVIAVASTSTYATSWTWTRLDYPGGYWTVPYGVSGTNIVGGYGALNHTHGFLYDGATWATLDYPGAPNTIALGVSGNKVVGYYNTNPGASDAQGFLYDASTSTWTSLRYPGATTTFVRDIDGNNIIGSYTASGHTHGFLYDGTTWTTLDYPGSGNCDPRGISGSKVTGYYYSNGTDYWFLYDGTTWKTLLGDPFDLGIGGLADNHGGIWGDNIVGHYKDSAGSSHGFLWDGAITTNLDYPAGTQATYTYPKGIDGNNIVGFYYVNMSNTPRGFFLTIPEPATVSLLVLGGLAVVRRRRRGRRPGPGWRLLDGLCRHSCAGPRAQGAGESLSGSLLGSSAVVPTGASEGPVAAGRLLPSRRIRLQQPPHRFGPSGG